MTRPPRARRALRHELVIAGEALALVVAYSTVIAALGWRWGIQLNGWIQVIAAALSALMWYRSARRDLPPLPVGRDVAPGDPRVAAFQGALHEAAFDNRWAAVFTALAAWCAGADFAVRHLCAAGPWDGLLGLLFGAAACRGIG